MDRVVPLAVEVVAGDRDRIDLGVADLYDGRVGVWVEDGVDGQASVGGGCGDGLDDDLVVGQRPAPPVGGDEREQPVLDFVPFRGAGWVVADGDLQAGLGGQLGQSNLPRP